MHQVIRFTRINNRAILHLCAGLLFFLSLTMTHALKGQGFLRTDGQRIVTESGDDFLLRGMGLGGWMLQEGYMLQTAEFANAQHKIRERITDLIGEQRAQEFYDAWLENHVTEADVIALKSWGFNSIRLPMHYNLFTLPIQQEPVEGEHTWLDKGIQLTDRLLEWCEKHEMYLVLDLHAAPGGQGQDEGISDYDPLLPSLWESAANQDKTVALWRRLADHYKDSPWIAGYDLINETNWNIPGGTALRNLYGRITEAIREVDQRHIIFIEGNWFANDFTGLTPPWDDNMVYSPHKYWSFNDQNSIQWVLDLRAEHNVPLYLGESGENSNVWFQEAIQLLEDNNIGWAWWPMKKIEDIAGPLSIQKTEGYERLLNFWKGNAARPDADEAYATLMDLTDKIKIENCRIQPDVMDAMFRQQLSDVTIPYSANQVPGIVYATDFDMGAEGQAYADNVTANFHVSTNNFTAWNNGWVYRNDGVDIEPCEDDVKTNGFNVGWQDNGEWMKYTLDVQESATYDIHLRVASTGAEGRLSFEVDGSPATEAFPVPQTGGFQAWQTMIVPDVVLEAGSRVLTYNVEAEGFNLSSMDFVPSGATTAIPFRINRALTLDNNNILLQFNKAMEVSTALTNSDFIIEVDGAPIEVLSARLSADSDRIIVLEVGSRLRSDDQIRVSYNQANILSVDQTELVSFTRFFVENTLDPILFIPGLIQSEDWASAEGIELESTVDIGLGQNIAFLDPGDYLEYEVTVERTGPYVVRYRVASEWGTGQIRVSLTDPQGQVTVLDEPIFPPTGGWQIWQTIESEQDITAGDYRLRIDILQSPFNMNWIEFESLLEEEEPLELGISVFPNPFVENLTLQAVFTGPRRLTYDVHDMMGRLVASKDYPFSEQIVEPLDLPDLAPGLYVMTLSLENGQKYQYTLMKTD